MGRRKGDRGQEVGEKTDGEGFKMDALFTSVQRKRRIILTSHFAFWVSQCLAVIKTGNFGRGSIS